MLNKSGCTKWVNSCFAFIIVCYLLLSLTFIPWCPRSIPTALVNVHFTTVPTPEPMLGVSLLGLWVFQFGNAFHCLSVTHQMCTRSKDPYVNTYYMIQLNEHKKLCDHPILSLYLFTLSESFLCFFLNFPFLFSSP